MGTFPLATAASWKPRRDVMALTSLMLMLTSLWTGVAGHGRLMDPPARNSMWRLGFNNPVNYNDNELYCGGRMVQWIRNGGKCGVCGDAYHGKREHEAGGKYANGIIARTFRQGDVMPITVHLTANHQGFFEIRVCPVNSAKVAVTQECLDRHLLVRADGEGERYPVPKGKYNAFFNYTVQLPSDLTCSQCVVQWKYRTGNTWDKDDNSGVFCLGCGPQEEFYNCADIEILPDKTTKSKMPPPNHSKAKPKLDAQPTSKKYSPKPDAKDTGIPKETPASKSKTPNAIEDPSKPPASDNSVSQKKEDFSAWQKKREDVKGGAMAGRHVAKPKEDSYSWRAASPLTWAFAAGPRKPASRSTSVSITTTTATTTTTTTATSASTPSTTTPASFNGRLTTRRRSPFTAPANIRRKEDRKTGSVKAREEKKHPAKTAQGLYAESGQRVDTHRGRTGQQSILKSPQQSTARSGHRNPEKSDPPSPVKSGHHNPVQTNQASYVKTSRGKSVTKSQSPFQAPKDDRNAGTGGQPVTPRPPSRPSSGPGGGTAREDWTSSRTSSAARSSSRSSSSRSNNRHGGYVSQPSWLLRTYKKLKQTGHKQTEKKQTEQKQTKQKQTEQKQTEQKQIEQKQIEQKQQLQSQEGPTRKKQQQLKQQKPRGTDGNQGQQHLQKQIRPRQQHQQPQQKQQQQQRRGQYNQQHQKSPQDHQQQQQTQQQRSHHHQQRQPSQDSQQHHPEQQQQQHLQPHQQQQQQKATQLKQFGTKAYNSLGLEARRELFRQKLLRHLQRARLRQGQGHVQRHGNLTSLYPVKRKTARPQTTATTTTTTTTTSSSSSSKPSPSCTTFLKTSPIHTTGHQLRTQLPHSHTHSANIVPLRNDPSSHANRALPPSRARDLQGAGSEGYLTEKRREIYGDSNAAETRKVPASSHTNRAVPLNPARSSHSLATPDYFQNSGRAFYGDRESGERPRLEVMSGALPSEARYPARPSTGQWWTGLKVPVWVTPTLLRCRATVRLGGGMDDWCTANCNANFCPPAMCVCQGGTDAVAPPSYQLVQTHNPVSWLQPHYKQTAFSGVAPLSLSTSGVMNTGYPQSILLPSAPLDLVEERRQARNPFLATYSTFGRGEEGQQRVVEKREFGSGTTRRRELNDRGREVAAYSSPTSEKKNSQGEIYATADQIAGTNRKRNQNHVMNDEVTGTRGEDEKINYVTNEDVATQITRARNHVTHDDVKHNKDRIYVQKDAATSPKRNGARNDVTDDEVAMVTGWGVMRRKTCRATGRYAGLSHYDSWCSANCARAMCPLFMCTCLSY